MNKLYYASVFLDFTIQCFLFIYFCLISSLILMFSFAYQLGNKYKITLLVLTLLMVYTNLVYELFLFSAYY